MVLIRITHEEAKILEEAKLIKKKQKESALKTNITYTFEQRKEAAKKRLKTIKSNKTKLWSTTNHGGNVNFLHSIRCSLRWSDNMPKKTKQPEILTEKNFDKIIDKELKQWFKKQPEGLSNFDSIDLPYEVLLKIINDYAKNK